MAEPDPSSLISKIRQCIDWQSIYALEEEFNSCALTIQTTPNNRVILCRIEKNKPVAKSIIDDYIFLASMSNSFDELSERAEQKLIDFVQNRCGKPTSIKNIAKVWRNGLRMYEAPISIVNEDMEFVAASVILE